jgi:hypothetical protein
MSFKQKCWWGNIGYGNKCGEDEGKKQGNNRSVIALKPR